MADVSIDGLFDFDSVNPEHKAVLDDGVKMLRSNPGKGVMLTLGGNNIEEQTETFKSVRGSFKKLAKTDSLYAGIILKLEKISADKLKASLREQEKVEDKPEKKNKKHNKSIKNAAKTPEKNPGQSTPEEQKAAEDAQNIMIQQIVANMSMEAAAAALAEKQAQLSQKEKELAVPNIPETNAKNLKSEIQMLKKLIEALQKKLKSGE
jgi:hypothetical protein